MSSAFLGALTASFCKLFGEAGGAAVAGQLDNAEAREAVHLRAGEIVLEYLRQRVQQAGALVLLLHVDEVDQDGAAQPTEAALAGELDGGGLVGGDDAPGAALVDIDKSDC